MPHVISILSEWSVSIPVLYPVLSSFDTTTNSVPGSHSSATSCTQAKRSLSKRVAWQRRRVGDGVRRHDGSFVISEREKMKLVGAGGGEEWPVKRARLASAEA